VAYSLDYALCGVAAYRGHPVRVALEALDPSLTLTRTQHAAIPGKPGNNESFIYAGYANPCNAHQPLTAHP
jgi:hypothetical protein